MTTTTRPRRSHGYITAPISNTRELVSQYRKNGLALYKLAARNGPADRPSTATVNAMVRRRADQYALESEVHLYGDSRQRRLVAALRDEQDTYARLQHAIMRAQDRPELVARLEAARKLIRMLTAG
jgi:hypothetical protein